MFFIQMCLTYFLRVHQVANNKESQQKHSLLLTYSSVYVADVGLKHLLIEKVLCMCRIHLQRHRVFCARVVFGPLSSLQNHSRLGTRVKNTNLYQCTCINMLHDWFVSVLQFLLDILVEINILLQGRI